MSFNWGAAGLPGTWLFFHGRRGIGAALVLVKFLWLYLILEHFPVAVALSFFISLGAGVVGGRIATAERGWTISGVIAIIVRLIFFGGLTAYYWNVGSFNIV